MRDLPLPIKGKRLAIAFGLMGHVRKNQSPRIVCDQAAAQELFLHKEQTQVFLDFEVGDKSSVELLGGFLNEG